MRVVIGSLGGMFCVWSGAACGNGSQELAASQDDLVAECVPSDAELDADAWRCPESRAAECVDGTGTASFPTLYVRDVEGVESCAGQTLTAQVGPLTVGSHRVDVRNEAQELVCTATAIVTDSAAPTLTPRTLFLWPPNHKFHTITVEQCAALHDACQGDQLKAEFVWASSDEPVDDIGDGHHAPDILIEDCGAVALRAERQGPRDGRVYKLGMRVVDGAGNASEAVCTVIVDHDQRGVVGTDSGESYRLTLDGTNGLPSCDGTNPPTVVSEEPEAPIPPTSVPDASVPDANVPGTVEVF